MKEMLREQKYSRGDVCFAVEMDWWRAWQKSVGWDTHSEPVEGTFEPPGEIKNTKLVNRYLPAKRGFSYEAVNERIWRAIVEWYGGGPEIPLVVMKNEEDRFVPPGSFSFLSVTCGGIKTKVLVAENTNVNEFTKSIRKEYRIADEVGLRIFKAVGENIRVRELVSGNVLKQAGGLHESIVVVNSGGSEDVEMTRKAEKTKEMAAKRELSHRLAREGQTKKPDETVVLGTDRDRFDMQRRYGTHASLVPPQDTSHIVPEMNESDSMDSVPSDEPESMEPVPSDEPEVIDVDDSDEQQIGPVSTVGKSLIITGANVSKRHVVAPPNDVQQTVPSMNIDDIDDFGYGQIPGCTGLMNLGNTCYFNSGVQCLMHTRPLMKYFLGQDWRREINECNPIGMRGELAKAFGNVAKQIWSSAPALPPKQLKDVMGQFATQFSGHSQQDSHELITFMLDGVHEDLNRCREKPVVEPVIGDGTDDIATGNLAWFSHKLRNDSVIVDLFQGQLRSRLRCPKCEQTTILFEPYMTLSLPVAKPSWAEFSAVFVPYDLQIPSMKLAVDLSKPERLNAAISEIVQRRVSVVPLTWNPASMDGDYKIGFPDREDDRHVLFLVEIPDPTESYVIGRIRTDRSDVTGPVAVKVTDMLDLESIEQGFESKFMEWRNDTEIRTECDATDEEITQLKEKLSNDVDMTIVWQEPQVFHVAFSAPYGFMPGSSENHTATPATNFPFVLGTVVHVYVNPCAIDERFARLMWQLDQCRRLGKTLLSRMDTEISLSQCFESFTQEETLDKDNEWHCPKCRQFVRARKTTSIWTVPKILIIQLRRFIGSHGIQSRKLDTLVTFPRKLDLADFVDGPHTNDQKDYRLYAVCAHRGGLAGGHYTAHARVSDRDQTTPGQWYYFNDSDVSLSSCRECQTPAAYLLFYEQNS